MMDNVVPNTSGVCLHLVMQPGQVCLQEVSGEADNVLLKFSSWRDLQKLYP